MTDEERKAAILYVRASGFYLTRLAKYLMMDFKILQRILKEDEGFAKQLEAAESEFVGETVRAVIKKRPDFILDTKYRKEFPKITKIEAVVDPHVEIGKILGRIGIGEKNDDTDSEQIPTSE